MTDDLKEGDRVKFRSVPPYVDDIKPGDTGTVKDAGYCAQDMLIAVTPHSGRAVVYCHRKRVYRAE